MSIGPLPKITIPNAADVWKRYEPEEEARSCQREGMSPETYLESLAEVELWSEAVKFLTQALSKRDAITWACQCVRSASGAEMSPPAQAALQAVDAWLADSTEARRRAAHAAAKTVGFDSPAGCVALGVFFSSGSLGPPSLDHSIPPSSDLTGKALAGALLIAAVITEPENAPMKLQGFIEQGLQFARGTAELN